MNEFVTYQSEENYAIITINNGKANAISHDVADGLNAGLDKAEQEDKIVILTGTQGIFSGGFASDIQLSFNVSNILDGQVPPQVTRFTKLINATISQSRQFQAMSSTC